MRLPTLKARELIKFIQKEGFVETHRKGSHRFFQAPDGRTTVVPVHKGKDIGRGLLREILHEIKLSPDEFQQLLRKRRN